MKNKKIKILTLGLVFLFCLGNITNFIVVENFPQTLKLSDNEITIVTPENKTYIQPMDGYFPATYGFENDEDGSDPDEWTMYEAGGYVNVKDAMGNHTKVVEMYDSVNNNHVLMSKTVPSQTSGTVEYWVMSDNVGKESIFRALEDPFAGAYGDGIGWLCLDQNKIRYHDNIGWHDTSKTIYDNTWYRIKVEFECTTGNYHGLDQYTWRFYVDGEEFGAFPFQVNINNVSQVFFSTRGEDLGYRCYLDAIGFSWDLDYNIGDNLYEGLLLSFENSTQLDWIGYSLDGQVNKTILGNIAFPMPSSGSHTVQVFGNNTLGIMYQSNKVFFSISKFLINLLSPENKTYIQPMDGYYPATYGFENDEDGSDPDEWTMYEAGGYVNVKDAMENHTKVVEMYDSVNDNHVLMSKPVPSQTSGTVEYWVMSDNVGKESIFRALEDPFAGAYGDGIGWLCLDRDKIRYHDNTGWHDTSKTIYDNTWYRIKVEFECTTGNYHGLDQYTWRFYVDGEEFGAFPFQVNIDNVSQVFFSTRGEDLGYRCYLDAIGFSWDLDYNIGDNLHEGLLLGYETNKDLDWMGYSLDNKANITIMGDKTISMPRNGSHVIQVFGNDSLGDMFQSEKRYFTTHYNSIDIITPENITYTAPMSGYYPGTYGFENDQNGDIPEGWIDYHSAIGCAIEVIDEKYGHRKVVELSDNHGSNIALMENVFKYPRPIGTIEFWIATTNAGKGTFLSFMDASGYTAFKVEIVSDKIKFLYQGLQYIEYGIEDGQWRHVRIDFNCVTDKMTYWLDGIVIEPDLNFYQSIDNIEKVWFNTDGIDSVYSSYIDAIGYSWDSYYRIGDNYEEGILFSYENYVDLDWKEFSLDSQTRQSILGNKTLVTPVDGMHSIQFFAQDSLGEYYESEMRYFTIEIAPSVEWELPIDGITVILPYTKPPHENDGLFTFRYKSRKVDDIELEIDGVNLGSVLNETSIVLTPYTDYTESGFLSATLIGINNSVIVDTDTRSFQFVKIEHEVTEVLNSSTKIIGKQLYLILHDPHGDNSFSSISESTKISFGVGSEITNAIGVSIEVGTDFKLFGIEMGASVLLEAKATLSQEYDFRYEVIDTTSLTSGQVSDDADYIGPGYGDRYWGESWIYKWVLNGTYREYSNGTNRWEKPKLYYGILRGVETFASDEHAPAEWRNQNAVYNDTIPVSWITLFQESGGATYTYEHEVSTTTTRKRSFQIDLGVDFGLKFGPLETHLKIELSVKTYAETFEGNIHKVAYEINDDDPSDFLVQHIGIDERFGTFIFKSESFFCETSHPLEHNTYDYLPPVIDFPTIDFDTNNDNFGPANDDSPLVRVNIFEEGGLQSVSINYTINNGLNWNLISLHELIASPGIWEGTIPSLTQGTKVKWYIIAWDAQGNRAERKDIYGNPFEYTVLEKPIVPSYPPMFIIVSLMIPVAIYILRYRKKLHKILT